MSGRLPPSEYELLAMIYERILLLSTPRQRRYEIAKIAKILEEFYGCAEHKPAGRSDTSTDFAKLDTPRTYGRRAEYLASTNSTSGPSIHNIGLSIECMPLSLRDNQLANRIDIWNLDRMTMDVSLITTICHGHHSTDFIQRYGRHQDGITSKKFQRPG